jgi:hypothetical protein
LLEAIAEALSAPDAKIALKKLDFVASPFGEPAALPGGIGESGESALWRLRETALDDEWALAWDPPPMLYTEVTASVSDKGSQLSSKYFSIIGGPCKISRRIPQNRWQAALAGRLEDSQLE